MRKASKVKEVVVGIVLVLVVGHACAGSLDPISPPGPTMHMLEEMYQGVAGIQNTVAPSSLPDPAPVPKTGQTSSWATGDDGDQQAGATWPTPRFTDNRNGTVTDNLTGLIWLKNANAFGGRAWATALTDCNTPNSGEAGLTDGSVEGNWRLPNRRELQSLIDYGRSYPALPAGYPFTGVQSDYYRSPSTYADNTDYRWGVDLPNGCVR